VRDLKGFAKVHLEPGATQTVAIDVPARDLAFYDVDAGAWEVEPIAYSVQVGPSLRDLPLAASFVVSGS
jgi:beta-glucosidase